jgi:uncharacterized protein (TIGR02302 family)
MSEGAARSKPFAIRLRLARAALWWEQAWPACWPALAVLGIFLVLSLSGLMNRLPGVVHSGLLLALGAAFLFALGAVLRAVRRPNENAARRRIERTSGLQHRPLHALADRPSAPLEPLAAGLWEAHRRQMAASARRLRVGLPAAGFAARDPWGLRALLTILLLLAVIDAGGDWRERLVDALTPSFDSGVPATAASLDIWVTPPEYTGLAPQFLRPADTRMVHIPIGSALLAQIHGGGAVPTLAIDGKAIGFEKIDDQNFRAQASLKSGHRIEISQSGATLGAWPIEIIPDTPPAIVFARPPSATVHQALRLDYSAADDYGVENVKAIIRRPGGGADKIELELPLPGLHLKEAHATSYHDLTAHLWAGLPVEIRLVAADALGQLGESQPALIKLPEREFHNPVARAIIEQRKELAKDPNSRAAVADILGDLHARPERYGNDMVVFLALRIAEQRLRFDRDAAAISQVEQLLWDTALRIEDAGVSQAESELRRLQRQLQQALAKNAPAREIDRLMNELRQALDRYLQALARNQQRNPQPSQQLQNGQQHVVTSRELERMLDRARELAKNGQREAAQQLLSELQNMLENLRTAQPSQNAQRQAGAAQQMMRGMRQLMQRQQQLLDRSFRAQQQAQQGQMAQQGDPNGQGGQDAQGEHTDMGDAAGQQEALRRALGEMMRRMGEGLGEIPDPLGRAERAMNDAAQALRRGFPGAAIGPQTDALDQLQQAAREFAQQMQQRLGNGMGSADDHDDEPGTGLRRSGERDPLGRPLNNGGDYDQGDVKIPDNNVMQRARDILDELRRRAGERDRPQLELDYIDRLLQRF